jgi:hypothetical protein
VQRGLCDGIAAVCTAPRRRPTAGGGPGVARRNGLRPTTATEKTVRLRIASGKRSSRADLPIGRPPVGSRRPLVGKADSGGELVRISDFPERRGRTVRRHPGTAGRKGAHLTRRRRSSVVVRAIIQGRQQTPNPGDTMRKSNASVAILAALLVGASFASAGCAGHAEVAVAPPPPPAAQPAPPAPEPPADAPEPPPAFKGRSLSTRVRHPVGEFTEQPGRSRPPARAC